MANNKPCAGTSLATDNTELTCNEFYSTECVIHPDALVELSLPENSQLNSIITAILSAITNLNNIISQNQQDRGVDIQKDGVVVKSEALKINFLDNILAAIDLGDTDKVNVQIDMPSYALSLGIDNVLNILEDSNVISSVDLSTLLDNTNLSRIVSGAVIGNDMVFTRDDDTTLTVDVSGLLGGSSDYINNVELNSKDLVFTGTGSAFNSTVDLSSFALVTDIVDSSDEISLSTTINNINNLQSILENHESRITGLASGGSDGVVSDVTLTGNNLNFTGTGGGFNGSVDLSSIGGGSVNELVTSTSDGDVILQNGFNQRILRGTQAGAFTDNIQTSFFQFGNNQAIFSGNQGTISPRIGFSVQDGIVVGNQLFNTLPPPTAMLDVLGDIRSSILAGSGDRAIGVDSEGVIKILEGVGGSDNQELTLTGSILQIEDGNSVDLSAITSTISNYEVIDELGALGFRGHETFEVIHDPNFTPLNNPILTPVSDSSSGVADIVLQIEGNGTQANPQFRIVVDEYDTIVTYQVILYTRFISGNGRVASLAGVVTPIDISLSGSEWTQTTFEFQYDGVYGSGTVFTLQGYQENSNFQAVVSIKEKK